MSKISPLQQCVSCGRSRPLYMFRHMRKAITDTRAHGYMSEHCRYCVKKKTLNARAGELLAKANKGTGYVHQLHADLAVRNREAARRQKIQTARLRGRDEAIRALRAAISRERSGITGRVGHAMRAGDTAFVDFVSHEYLPALTRAHGRAVLMRDRAPRFIPKDWTDASIVPTTERVALREAWQALPLSTRRARAVPRLAQVEPVSGGSQLGTPVPNQRSRSPVSHDQEETQSGAAGVVDQEDARTEERSGVPA